MELPVAWSLLLLVVAAWNLFIWPQFWRRVTKDGRARDADGRPTAFFRVHAVLIGVSLVLAVAVGVLGILTLV
ncbi:hypothetical protein ASD11_00310 [Aeromicrobium sp. Root495]|uniref:SCO4848 family membrane protein n=1 Tax=Aeromicrobium sp. Root495 TaxID=1736550 RepID=UPI0006FF4AAA|nr:hypothetical protein [Aeromicrobium sp. Root495]KQY58153.1 hypothetical protein ASD11_00310 [Aeromicrobium sp. Root495]RYJ06551.1 MAG: hypothetical protein EON52_05770 [Actinomycetales bacterium]